MKVHRKAVDESRVANTILCIVGISSCSYSTEIYSQVGNLLIRKEEKPSHTQRKTDSWGSGRDSSNRGLLHCHDPP